jgi:putative ABC transport system permease protein
MVAIGAGARAEAIEKIKELGATNIILRSVKPTAVADAGGGRAGVRYGLTDADLNRILTVPAVRSATPSRERRMDARYRQRHIDARIVGCTPAFQDLNHLRVRRGRFLTEVDVRNQALVVVLAAQTADALFPLENPIGRSIRLGEHKYVRVVGVTEPRGPSTSLGGGLPMQDYNRDIYIPFSTDRKEFGQVVAFHRATQQAERLEISQITVAVDSVARVKGAATIISNLVDQYHRQEDTAATVPLELLEKVEQTQRIFAIVLGSIASISLLVGGIGIMNIMLATVTERTREIGIRRAVGAKRRDIARQFLCETVVLSGTGGLVGLAIGLGIAVALPHVLGIPSIVQLWSPMIAVVISLSVGVVFGAYPAHRAARMDPIEALRYE